MKGKRVHIGTMIRRLRREKKATRQEMSDATGISIHVITNCENCYTASFSEKDLRTISSYFGMSLYSFLYWVKGNIFGFAKPDDINRYYMRFLERNGHALPRGLENAIGASVPRRREMLMFAEFLNPGFADRIVNNPIHSDE